MTITVPLEQGNRQEYYTELSLRVRVGGFLRHETVDFGDTAFVMRGT